MYKPIDYSNIKSVSLSNSNRDEFESWKKNRMIKQRANSSSIDRRKLIINNNIPFFNELRKAWNHQCNIQLDILKSEKPQTCFFCKHLYLYKNEYKCSGRKIKDITNYRYDCDSFKIISISNKIDFFKFLIFQRGILRDNYPDLFTEDSGFYSTNFEHYLKDIEITKEYPTTGWDKGVLFEKEMKDKIIDTFNITNRLPTVFKITTTENQVYYKEMDLLIQLKDNIILIEIKNDKGYIDIQQIQDYFTLLKLSTVTFLKDNKVYLIAVYNKKEKEDIKKKDILNDCYDSDKKIFVCSNFDIIPFLKEVNI